MQKKKPSQLVMIFLIRNSLHIWHQSDIEWSQVNEYVQCVSYKWLTDKSSKITCLLLTEIHI